MTTLLKPSLTNDNPSKPESNWWQPTKFKLMTTFRIRTNAAYRSKIQFHIIIVVFNQSIHYNSLSEFSMVSHLARSYMEFVYFGPLVRKLANLSPISMRMWVTISLLGLKSLPCTLAHIQSWTYSSLDAYSRQHIDCNIEILKINYQGKPCGIRIVLNLYTVHCS